ncbi:MAG: hypothetical protein HZA00_10825 [Nitrospinae bacterium]|nr:hypothetical protein [Nitrospinota bacterium]
MGKINLGIFVILLALFASAHYVEAQKSVKEDGGPPIIIIFRANEDKSKAPMLRTEPPSEQSASSPMLEQGGRDLNTDEKRMVEKEGENSKREMEGKIKSYKKDKKELDIQFKNSSEKFKVNDDISGKFKEDDLVIIKPSGKKGGYELYKEQPK